MTGGYENASEDTMISIYNEEVDPRLYGSCFGLCRRLVIGGAWGGGSYCGSRCMHGSMYSARVVYGVDRATRGCSKRILSWGNLEWITSVS
jgi:hypothetical protein